MQPVPEPAGDIHAQISATLDPHHPKRACFLTPGDQAGFNLERLPVGTYAAVRDEGTLVTTERDLAEMFEGAPDDTQGFDNAMAYILGLGEPKPLMVERCRGDPARYAKAVQARDAHDHVITETFASPLGYLNAVKEMRRHVPEGGSLVTIGAVLAISRRVAMRWIEQPHSEAPVAAASSSST